MSKEVYLNPSEYQEQIDAIQAAYNTLEPLKFEMSKNSLNLRCIDRLAECIKLYQESMNAFDELQRLDIDTYKTIKSNWMNLDASKGNYTAWEVLTGKNKTTTGTGSSTSSGVGTFAAGVAANVAATAAAAAASTAGKKPSTGDLFADKVKDALEDVAEKSKDLYRFYAEKKFEYTVNLDKASETEVAVGQIRFVKSGNVKTGMGDFDKAAWPEGYSGDGGCIAAAHSMALSSLGIDVLPKDMADKGVMASGNGYMYKGVDTMVENIKRNTVGDLSGNPVEKNMSILDEALQRYKENPEKYSPPVVRVPGHSIVVTDKVDGLYKVVDPGGYDQFKTLNLSTENYLKRLKGSDSRSSLIHSVTQHELISK